MIEVVDVFDVSLLFLSETVTFINYRTGFFYINRAKALVHATIHASIAYGYRQL